MALRRWLAAGLVLIIATSAWRMGVWSWAVWQRRQLDQALATRDFDAAGVALDRCFWFAPHEPELRLLAARLARRQGHLDEAWRQLRLCQSEHSLAGQIGLEGRLMRIQSGDFTDSAALDEYVARQPVSPEALLIEEAQILGSLAALDVPRARKYLAAWNRRRQLPSDRLQGLLWEATCDVLAAEPQQALTQYRQALTLDPDNRAAQLAVAELLTDSDPAEAATYLSVLRRSSPADRQVLFQQALVQRNLGRLEAAAQTLDELLALEPQHVEGLVARGRIALDLDRLDDAGQWLERAEAIEPKHRAVMLAKVDYLRAVGRLAEAEQYEQRMAEVAAEVKEHVERVLHHRRQTGAGVSTPAPVQGPSQR